MKSLLWAFIFGCLFISQNSSAQGYIYQSKFVEMGNSYTDKLSNKSTDSLDSLTNEKRDRCLQRYNPIWADGLIDIRIALGYFDWTTGSNVFWDGKSYGVSPSLDIATFAALRDLLTSSCYGNLRFCGFRADPNNAYRFVKNVQIHGRSYQARIEMHFSSATEYLESNLGSARDTQKQRTQYTENFFLNGLQSADAMFYFGHSRNGGGPDFNPPVFVSGQNKVNYNGYYKVQQPGFRKMVAALQSSEKTPILGLMSCASRDHFLSRLRQTAPATGVITSMDVLEIDVVYTAMIGAIDAILRGQCQSSFYQSMRLNPANQQYITMDGMFE